MLMLINCVNFELFTELNCILSMEEDVIIDNVITVLPDNLVLLLLEVLAFSRYLGLLSFGVPLILGTIF